MEGNHIRFKMKKICILKERVGFWKEHGVEAYSNNILQLYELIKDKDFQIVIGKHNDFIYDWETVQIRCNRKQKGMYQN